MIEGLLCFILPVLDEPALAGLLSVAFFCLFSVGTFVDKWHTLFVARCPLCHLTKSVSWWSTHPFR